MKKTKQIKLRLVREAVRALQTHELQQVEGGNDAPNRGDWTGDSKNVCCA
jgi:natural product precursor